MIMKNYNEKFGSQRLCLQLPRVSRRTTLIFVIIITALIGFRIYRFKCSRETIDLNNTGGIPSTSIQKVEDMVSAVELLTMKHGPQYNQAYRRELDAPADAPPPLISTVADLPIVRASFAIGRWGLDAIGFAVIVLLICAHDIEGTMQEEIEAVQEVIMQVMLDTLASIRESHSVVVNVIGSFLTALLVIPTAEIVVPPWLLFFFIVQRVINLITVVVAATGFTWFVLWCILPDNWFTIGFTVFRCALTAVSALSLVYLVSRSWIPVVNRNKSFSFPRRRATQRRTRAPKPVETPASSG